MDLWRRADELRALIERETRDLSPADRWTVLSVATGQALGDAEFPHLPKPDLCESVGRLVGHMAARRQCERELDACLISAVDRG